MIKFIIIIILQTGKQGLHSYLLNVNVEFNALL